MTFVTEVDGPGGQMWIASVARSLWRGPLPTIVHQRGSENIPLWWGPVVQVDPGDEIVMLPTPSGYAVEDVIKAELL
jgi:hypothetical protein